MKKLVITLSMKEIPETVFPFIEKYFSKEADVRVIKTKETSHSVGADVITAGESEQLLFYKEADREVFRASIRKSKEWSLK